MFLSDLYHLAILGNRNKIRIDKTYPGTFSEMSLFQSEERRSKLNLTIIVPSAKKTPCFGSTF